MFKRFFLLFLAPVLGGCSTNAATGKQQFTAFMSPQQELRIGAEQHQNIIKEFGLYEDEALQHYLNTVGKKVAQHTERQDLSYKFYLLDAPDVNAFALPGGYVYMTRGIMALANSEAEFASVLGHEVGHVTGRHGAERYSRSVVTGLSANILSVAIGDAGVSNAIGLGANLYLTSYSRGQETEADSLGIRYISRTGYAPIAAQSFFKNMQANQQLELKKDKKKSSGIPNYLSTHPAVQNRVAQTGAEAARYSQEGVFNRERYLRAIDGMTFGDSADKGFVKDRDFYHPKIGFTFRAPQGFKIVNQPTKVIMQGEQSGILFDIAGNEKGHSAHHFLSQVWLAKQQYTGFEKVVVNGLPAATAVVYLRKSGKDLALRFFAIEWSPKQIVRFVIEMPRQVERGHALALRDSVYSFRRLSQRERQTLKPYKLRIINSTSRDTVASLSKRMAVEQLKEEHFRVLNGLTANDKVVAGRLYKIVVE